MKKLALLFVVALLAVPAFANDVFYLKAKNGDVTFSHKNHQDVLKTCTPCHTEAIPAKFEMNKDVAHVLCKDCHAKMTGPTKCGECHKK